jgi:hypothetical protein
MKLSLRPFSPDKNAVVAALIAAVSVFKLLGCFLQVLQSKTTVPRMEGYEWVAGIALWVLYTVCIVQWKGMSRLAAMLLFVNALLLAARRELQLNGIPADAALYLQTGLWFSLTMCAFNLIRIVDRQPSEAAL